MKKTILAIVVLTSLAAGFENRRTLPIEPETSRQVRSLCVEFKREDPGIIISGENGSAYLLIIPTNSIREIEADFVQQ